LFLLLAFHLPDSGHGYDFSCWSAWMRQLDTQPFHRIYDIDCNYLPGYLYLLKFHVWLMGSAEAASQHLHVLKLYTLLFDIGSVLLMLSMCRLSTHSNRHWALFVFNGAYFFNTLNWGQIDAIPAFFTLLSLRLFLQNRAIWALPAYILALNVKLQMIIFLPIILWLLWDALRGKPRLYFVRTGLLSLGFQSLLILPFLLGGSIVPFWRVVIGSVGFFQRVSMNAFNFWYLVLPESTNPILADDRSPWISGISYQNWGMLLLLGSALFGAWLLFGRRLILAVQQRTFPKFALDDYLLAGSILALCFFYFPTQMHERYSHPAWLFLGLWSIRTHRYLPIFIFSLAYFLNMEMVLRSMELPNYEVWYFKPAFTASLYSILLLYLMRQALRQGRSASC
jgi:Gpi18-like mannosyltransferase